MIHSPENEKGGAVLSSAFITGQSQKNSLVFLSRNSRLQFNSKTLDEEPLSVIAEMFNDNLELPNDENPQDFIDYEIKDHEIFDKPGISEAELNFIDDLRVEEDEKDSDLAPDDLSYDSSLDSLNELEEKKKVRDFRVITQYNLDEQLNLNESLVGDFDCFNSKAES